MVYLVANYDYDWNSLKKEQILSAKMFDFLTWFSKSEDILQLDIETNVVDKLYDREVYVVQIGDKDPHGDQWVFDIPRMSEKDILTLKSVLSSRKKTWIIHNAAFEYTVLKMVFGVELYKVLDTFLMSKVLFNGKETMPGFHGLAGALDREFNLQLSKEEQTSFTGDPLSLDQITYAATDVLLMGQLYDRFKSMSGLNNADIVIDLENKAVRAFGDIQTNGLRIDWDEWMGNAAVFTNELALVQDELNAMLFEPAMYQDCLKRGLIQAQDEYFFRWNSIAFKKVIVEILGLHDFKPTLPNLKEKRKELEEIEDLTFEQDIQLKAINHMINKTFSKLELLMMSYFDEELIKREIKVLKDTIIFEWSQQAKRLEALQIIHPQLTSTSDQSLSRLSSPIVRKYKEWIKKSKLVTSFGESFKKYVDGDNKIRTSIQQVLATGRISSRDPNLQQLPHVSRFRNPFKSDSDNYSLTIADYSSQEVLIAATLSKETAWLDAVKNDYDLHSYNASLIFGKDWTDAAEDNCSWMQDYSQCKCPKHKELRTFSKTITFGLIYGMGVMKLSETLDISKTKANELMQKFFDTFPNVEAFMNTTKQSGIDNLYIETAAPYYRKRYFEAPRDGKEEAGIRRKSGNTVIQGTAADMVKLALVKIKEELDENREWDVQIKMQIHDEIICQARNDQVEAWAEMQSKLMEDAASTILGHNLLKSTVIISNQWEK